MSASSEPPRRRYRRRTVRVRVDYQVDGAQRCEWATTLGAGGMFIETEQPARNGARLKVRFRLSAGSEQHEIEARVAWSIGAAGPDESLARSPGMGIEFTDAVASAALARELERDEPTGG
ncbi:MAG TPA: PilZ domain-containing protein [Myxococcota bacterium]|nr:PilZ domain-containing protein [Myxococcota bacterium]